MISLPDTSFELRVVSCELLVGDLGFPSVMSESGMQDGLLSVINVLVG